MKRQLLLIVVFTVLLNLTGPILLDDLFYPEYFDRIKAEDNQGDRVEEVSKIDNLNQALVEYGLFDLLATYTTSFDSDEENRNENIRLAAESIDELMVKPGAIFSFNDIVGPRTEARGYKEALEIVGGELVDGIGGGICQVTSTLYNSVLMADLEVKARRNHSRPVSYVDKGRGATVYYGSIDFKFKNSSSRPIIILTGINNNQLTVSILGRRESNKSIAIETEIIEILTPEQEKKIDDSLDKGESKVVRQGQRGYRVRVFRVVREGSSVEREVITTDIFSPRNEIIAISPFDAR